MPCHLPLSRSLFLAPDSQQQLFRSITPKTVQFTPLISEGIYSKIVHTCHRNPAVCQGWRRTGTGVIPAARGWGGTWDCARRAAGNGTDTEHQTSEAFQSIVDFKVLLSNSSLNKPPVQGAPPVGSSRNHFASETENEFKLGHLRVRVERCRQAFCLMAHWMSSSPISLISPCQFRYLCLQHSQGELVDFFSQKAAMSRDICFIWDGSSWQNIPGHSCPLSAEAHVVHQGQQMSPAHQALLLPSSPEVMTLLSLKTQPNVTASMW